MNLSRNFVTYKIKSLKLRCTDKFGLTGVPFHPCSGTRMEIARSSIQAEVHFFNEIHIRAETQGSQAVHREGILRGP